MSAITKRLVVSASPHFRSKTTTTTIMLDVIIAMIPALIASVILFGYRSLVLTAVSVISCVVFEYLSRKVMKRHNTIGDLSAVVTGMLLAFNLPSTMPYWMVIIGAFTAIVIAKQFFGGIGNNFVNPALIGRIVLMASYPSQIGNFVAPFSHKGGVDAVTTATPLAQMTTVYSAENLGEAMGEAGLPSLLDMFFGVKGGCLGEVCILALVIGFLYLVIRKVISPVIPLVYVGTVAVAMLVAGKGDFTFMAYQIMAGGLVLGAVFMATDYTTSPVSFKGKIIYAIGCGVLTSLIRIFGSLPEGVSFSIIIMNILVPHIEHLTTARPFGEIKEKKNKKEAEAK